MMSSLVLLLLIQATLTYGATIISVNNGGPWGNWGEWQYCPPGTSASGFSLRVEKPLGTKGDDTALNAIMLYCTEYGKRDVVATMTSTIGPWGDWTSISWCPRGIIISFSLKVEKRQVFGDDTAANNIKMACSDPTTLEGKGGPWGTYGNWSGVCAKGFCGIRTKVENSQNGGDDTSLNDVQFQCCP